LIYWKNGIYSFDYLIPNNYFAIFIKKLNFFHRKTSIILLLKMETIQSEEITIFTTETSTQTVLSYENIREKFLHYGKIFIELFGIYFFWIVFHYISAHLYSAWCAPMSLVGFILSPFFVPAPHCQAFRWVISNGSLHITAMWFTLGGWCVKKIIG